MGGPCWVSQKKMGSWGFLGRPASRNPVQPGWSCSPEAADLSFLVSWGQHGCGSMGADSAPMLTQAPEAAAGTLLHSLFSKCREGLTPAPKVLPPPIFWAAGLRGGTEQLTAWTLELTQGSSKHQPPSNELTHKAGGDGQIRPLMQSVT